MTVKEAIEFSIKVLKDKGIESYALDSVMLVGEAMDKEKEFLFSHPEVVLSLEEESMLMSLIKRRRERCPVAYIVGWKEFYGVRFDVDPRVLIPRPETEVLVDTALKYSHMFNSPKILDVGCGSGNIAVTMSLNLGLCVYASDISLDALSVAHLNAGKLGACVRFVCGDAMRWTSHFFDIVVSNPPYVPDDMYLELPRDVLYEPRIALASNGDRLFRDLLGDVGRKMRLLIAEVGHRQFELVKHRGDLVEVVECGGDYPKIVVMGSLP